MSVADYCPCHRHHFHTNVGVRIRILLAQRRTDCVDVSLRLIKRYPRLQTRDAFQKIIAALFGHRPGPVLGLAQHRHRRPDLRAEFADWKFKSFGHYSNHREFFSVERQ